MSGALKTIQALFNKWGKGTPSSAFYDRTLFWLFISLLLIGFVMVTSASLTYSMKDYSTLFHYSIRDAIYILISLVIFIICIHIPLKIWEDWHTKLLLLAIFALSLVLIPGIGVSVNGAQRWIYLGVLNFQPAEFAKLALICYFAGFFVRKYDEVMVKQFSFFKPFIVLFVIGCFLLVQPDLGSVFVIVFVTTVMLFIAGAKKLQFMAMGSVGVLLFFVLIVSSDYRMKRIAAYRHPFEDPFGVGFQLTNSLMAFGRGKVFGVGLGNSVQKLDYLPEAHTDFIMAIIGEELGLVGIVFIVLLLGLLVYKGLRIGWESLELEERFKGFFAIGIGFWIFIQGFVNLGMALGLLPTKGLTFPLISYGGSSMLMMSIAIAVLIRIDYENKMARNKVYLRND